eukprot:TRINITY_DN8768_c0_g5_i1.p1 TRINITY_DN8768_c0_g5~~TRINITY_DN8768_c0_g5_i1.p1  ORF type:complete len:801 (+),score=321.58 TRINITY_DN8768_c0_g5_i1:132-2534(+)
MCTIPFEVDKDWLNPDPTLFFEGEEEEDNINFGKKAVSRVLSAANKKEKGLELTLLSPILLECFSNEKDWRLKNAGLLSLSAVGEYLASAANLSELVPIMVTHMGHAHPKVRFAAAQCIGEISQDCTDFPNMYHEQIMSALFNGLSDPVARVQRHMCSALCKFIDQLKMEVIDKYATKLMLKLEEVLKTAGPIVQEHIMSAISTVAEVTPINFKLNYYDHTMPFLIKAMEECKDFKLKRLRGSIIECITVIAKVVGKEKFRPHAKTVIKTLYNIQEHELESQDPQKYFLLNAWERLCLVLKEDLVPYIDQLMPSLLNLAATVPGLTISTMRNSTMDLENAVKQLTSTELPSAEEKRKMVHVSTTATEEKESAIAMLRVMVDELGGYMDKYVEKISALLLHILRYSGLEDLRTAAASSLNGLLKAIQSPRTTTFPADYIGKVARTYLEVLMTAMLDEDGPEALLVEVEAMCNVLKSAGRCLDEAGVLKVYQAGMKLIKDSEMRNVVGIVDADYSDEEELEAEEKETEAENELQLETTQIVTVLFQTHPEESLCLVKLLYPAYLSELLKPESSSHQKQLGIYFIVDMVEYLGYARIPEIYPQFVEAIFNYSSSIDPPIRQACLYGIGAIAMSAGGYYSSVATKCYAILSQALSQERPKEVKKKKWLSAQDNGISSLGKTIKHQSTAFPDLKPLLTLWLDKMPLDEDHIEGLIQNEILADLVLHDTGLVLGANGEQFEMVMDIFVDVIGTEQVNEAVELKISKAINMLAGVPGLKDKFTKYGADLETEQREKLEECFKIAQKS